ncbi:hypothetical protein K402DRAFT_191917 [Aulographum hederae CBS 113979]|uniref:Uncharacterized protein n=1 Tax=Aulographum hederae CBS 113979 TaxID=1176131 RepID=A0A6G1GPC7_9PEZI|nr:hypothetical protein K402DRAFT_191917 [Aulographum hederae CBS 113979]
MSEWAEEIPGPRILGRLVNMASRRTDGRMDLSAARHCGPGTRAVRWARNTWVPGALGSGVWGSGGLEAVWGRARGFSLPSETSFKWPCRVRAAGGAPTVIERDYGPVSGRPGSRRHVVLPFTDLSVVVRSTWCSPDCGPRHRSGPGPESGFRWDCFGDCYRRRR